MLPNITKSDFFFLFSQFRLLCNVTVHPNERQTAGLAADACEFGEGRVLTNIDLDFSSPFRLNFPSKVFLPEHAL